MRRKLLKNKAAYMRINELARELEVKAKAILDFLPTIGIADKLSHSSSVSEEIAEKLRQHFAGATATATEGEAAGKEEPATGQAPASAPEPAAPKAVEQRHVSPVSASPPEPRPAPPAAGAYSWDGWRAQPPVANLAPR